MSEKETIHVPIPAGDHNPEVQALIEQSEEIKDTENVQEAPRPSSLRASNVVETLKPKEILAVDYPVIKEYLDEPADDMWSSPEALTGYQSFKENRPLEDRVQRLEEQIDSLLDRIAQFNIRSRHRL